MINSLKKFANNLVCTAMVRPLIILTYTGHSFDVLTTWYALTRTGAKEANPFLAWLVESQWSGRWVALSGLKFVVLKQRNKIFGNDLRGYLVDCVVVWLVVLWNCGVIFRRRNALPS